MTDFFHVAKNSLVKGDSITKRKWLRFVGLTAIELILVTLLALPFLKTISAHPALPQDLEHDLQMVEPVEMGPQADLFVETAGARVTLPDDLEHNLHMVEPAEMGAKFDPSLPNNGPEAAIPELQGSTTLTVSIKTSPNAIVSTGGGPNVNRPSIIVIEAAVTNQGPEIANNVDVVLDFLDPVTWTLASGEVPTRTVSTLDVSETAYVYWFAHYITSTPGLTHTYTVSASANNATPAVSTSQNSYTPTNLDYTLILSNYVTAGNQGLDTADLSPKVGVSFTMVQTYSTGSNVNLILLGPVGNSDFDADALRLTSVKARLLSGTQVLLDIFTDTVYLAASDSTNTSLLVVEYEFVPILPKITRICPYAGIIANNFGQLKYDIRFCDTAENTVFTVDGTLALSMTKTVDKRDVEQGENLLYTITYTNNATETVGSMWIWDDVPTETNILTTDIISSGDGTVTYDEAQSSDTRAAFHVTDVISNGTGQIQIPVQVDGDGTDIPDNTVLTNEANLAIVVPSSADDNNDALRVLVDTATTTVHAPTVTATKTDGADTARPGDFLTYTIEITNTGSATATVTVTDTVPSTYIILGALDPNPDSSVLPTLVWKLTVLTTTPTVITIPYQIDPELSAETDIINNATLSYQNSSAEHLYPTKPLSDTTTSKPDLTALDLTKTAEDLDGEPLLAGDTIRYSVEVTNTGTFTAYDVLVTDTLPSLDDITCGSVSVTQGLPPLPSCPISPSTTITWTVGSLAANGDPGYTASMTIDVTINQDVLSGTSIINTASVSSSNVTTPPNPEEVCPDNSTPTGGPPPECTDSGSQPEPKTTLTLNKTAEPGGGNPNLLEVGDTITYTVWVTNNDSVNTAYGVVVTDTLSEYVTCQDIKTPSTGSTTPSSCPATMIEWNVGTLAGDAGASLQIVVTINDPEGLGQIITNTAVATGSNVFESPTPPVVCPDDANTPPNCDKPGYKDTTLETSKTAEADDPLIVGGTITYTIEITNSPVYTAFDVTVTDDMSEYVTCQSVSVSAGSTPSCPTTKPPNTIIWSAGDMAPSAVVSMVLIVEVDLSGEGQSITNTVSVTSSNVSTPPPPPVVCPNPLETPPCTPAELLTTTLELTKTADADDPLIVGGNITYTVQVTNTGDNTAYNVVITDTLSPYVDCVSVTVISGPAGASCPSPIVWTIAKLPGNNTSYSMIILVTVKASGEGQSITNTVEISGVNVIDPPDPPVVCPEDQPPDPVTGECTTKPGAGSPGGPFLPIIIKN